MTSILLALDAGLIGYLVGVGNPQNSLHVSALSWGFTFAAVLSLGYLLGSGAVEAFKAMLGARQ